MYIVACLWFSLLPSLLDEPTLLPCHQPCLLSHILLLQMDPEPDPSLASSCLVTRALIFLLHLPALGQCPGQGRHACPVAALGSWLLPTCAAAAFLLLLGHRLCCWGGRSLHLAGDFMHLSQAKPCRTRMKCNSRVAYSSFSEDNLCSFNLVSSQV